MNKELSASQSFLNRKFEQLSFDDGGSYSGSTCDGKADGFGICTGPSGVGEYAGAWADGFEASGVYRWANGNEFAGQWSLGKRHGLGCEKRGKWTFTGEVTNGTLGRYAIKCCSHCKAKYEGTWTSGVQDGYGVETYSDGGTYEGQWLKGTRCGYGVRRSAVYASASLCQKRGARKSSLTSARSEEIEEGKVDEKDVDLSVFDETLMYWQDTKLDHSKQRLGFCIRLKSGPSYFEEVKPATNLPFAIKPSPDVQNAAQKLAARRKTLAEEGMGGRLKSIKITKKLENDQEKRLSGKKEFLPIGHDVVETYSGEWKADKRHKFGVSVRSDGVKYEGEWLDNQRHGFGMTTLADGRREEGEYKYDVIQAPGNRLQRLKVAGMKTQVEIAVASAQKAAQIALQKSHIAVSRAEHARTKAELSEGVIEKAKLDSETARCQLVEYINQLKEQQDIPLNKKSKTVSIDQKIKQTSQNTQKPSLRRRPTEFKLPEPIDDEQNWVSQLDSDKNTFAESNLNNNWVTKSPYDTQISSQSNYDSNAVNNRLPITNSNRPNNMNKNHFYLADGISGKNVNHSTDQNSPHMAVSNNTNSKPGMIYQIEQPNIVEEFSYKSLMPNQLNDINYSIEEQDEFLEESQILNSINRFHRNFRRPSTSHLVEFNRKFRSNILEPVARRSTLPCIINCRVEAPQSPNKTPNDVIGPSTSANNNDRIVIKEGEWQTLEEATDEDFLDADLLGCQNVLERRSALSTTNQITRLEQINEETAPDDSPQFFRKPITPRYRLTPVYGPKRQDLGSLPDLHTVTKRWQFSSLPFEKVQELGRREAELRAEWLDQEEIRRRKSLIIRVGDFKWWVWKNFVFILLLSFNIFLSYIFLQLLSPR